MIALEIADFWLSGQWVTGTFVVTPVVAKRNYKSWNVACDDGDTLMTINHGFTNNSGVAVAPDFVGVRDLTSDATATPSNWAVQQVTATQIVLAKQGAAGSGGAPAVKVWATRPHSVIQ